MDKVKIKDVCDILNGFAFKSDNYVDKGIRIIRIANVQKGYIEDSTPAFYPLNSTGLDKYMLDKGDLLISLTGNVGRVAILQEEMLPAALNQRVACLRIKSDKISKGYLFHILNSDFFERKCIQSAKGVAQKNMSTEWLKNYKIPLYSTEQQSEIVSVLDTLQSIICNRKYELQMLNNLIKARFIELFGDPLIEEDRYPRVPLGSLAEVGSSKRIFEKEYVSEGIPFYRTKEIVELSKGNRITTELFITKERYDQIRSEYGAPQKGDLLISAVGTIGVIWIVDGKNDFYFKDGNLLRVSATEKFVPEYLKHLLEALISAYKSEMSSGTAYAALTISALKEMMVYDVPHAEQEQFAAFVEQTDKSKLLSGCRFFHSWVPPKRNNLNHVGVPRRRTKDLRGIRRQHAHLHH